MGNGWTFADLDPDQLALVIETERTLDTDIVMVYRAGAQSWADIERMAEEGLAPVELDPTQLERLQGMERSIGAVAVAYKRVA
jgi:hypothetical protein